MDQSTTVLDIDFGMSQLSGNKKLLFTLLGKVTDKYRSLDSDLQAHVAKGDFNEALLISADPFAAGEARVELGQSFAIELMAGNAMSFADEDF